MFRDYFEDKLLVKNKKSEILEAKKDSVDIVKNIRDKVKVKNIIPTRFGVEVVLFNTADAKEAAKIAGTTDVEDTSIFIKG
jgi:hypothetical protein